MKSGQTIVEVMVAFAVAIIVVLGLAQLATKSVTNSGASSRQAQASSIAIQGLEWVRGQRDTIGWGAFYAKSGTYCMSTLAWGGSPPCSAVTGYTEQYTRSVVMTPTTVSGVQQMQTTVTVSWNEGGLQLAAVQSAVYTSY